MAESQPTPRKGDKVRVAVESTVTEQGHYLGRMWVLDGKATLEILELGDDPSRDPIGTVAEFDDLVWVKTGERVWTEVGDPDHFRVDAAFGGRTVTGAVPGTPAAEAQADPKARTSAATCLATKRLGNSQLIHCSNAAWHEATTEHYARHAGQDVFW